MSSGQVAIAVIVSIIVLWVLIANTISAHDEYYGSEGARQFFYVMWSLLLFAIIAGLGYKYPNFKPFEKPAVAEEER